MGKTRVNGKTKAERTKELIFQSALTLFRQNGFEQVTVEDITNFAGISKGSFYTYFQTKSDIIVEEFWAIDSFYRSIEPLIQVFKSASEKLLKFTELQMLYVRDTIGCDMLKILYANQVLQDGSDKVIVDRSRFWHTFIARIIAEGQASGEFADYPDAQQLASFFNRAMRGMLLDWNISSASFDLVETSLQYCSQFLMAGIRRRS
ncbi:MAG: TetR/AcrR family transcriptional regulator [Spirochaetes bacterium]|nr:TetR/AcrR family transcriptional regulator [Spirochaetota bacterium]